jgi:hypothetical protein
VLLLKYLDDFEADKETPAELNGKTYRRIIDGEYRCRAWAAPKRLMRGSGLLQNANAQSRTLYSLRHTYATFELLPNKELNRAKAVGCFAPLLWTLSSY